MKTHYFMFGYLGYAYKVNEIAHSYIIEAKDKREAKKIFKSLVCMNLEKYTCDKMLVNILTRERTEGLIS